MLPAPRVAALATIVLAAAERTAEVLSTCIAWMREEANSTVATANRAVFQTGTNAQDGIERELILTNKRKGAVVLVPILAKRENFPDGYDKTARFSVKMLSGLSISSSYTLDAKASRCGARIFLCNGTEATAQHPRNPSTPQPFADLPLLPSSCDYPTRRSECYLERRIKQREERPNSSFPSSGSS